MSVETLLPLAYFWTMLFAALMVWLAAMFIIHFFVPKAMVRAYFREPYFSRAEIAIYNAFPFNYFRDIMFMRLAGWPSSGKKRGLTDAYKLAPSWFQVVSRIFIRLYLVIFTSMVLLGAFLYFSFCVFHSHC